MGKTIVILGNCSEADLERIEGAALQHGYKVSAPGSDAQPGMSLSEQSPSAFISFQSCTPAIVIEQFRNLPIGTGEKIPFFQRIEKTIPPFAHELPIAGFFEVPLTKAVIINMIKAIERNEKLLNYQQELSAQVAAVRMEMGQMVEIGTALSYENDIRSLLELILSVCRQAVQADAGSIYVRERAVPGGPFINSLLFMVAQNDSVDIKRGSHHSLPIDTESIAGYVASTGKPLNIDDVANIDSSLPFRASSAFQHHFGYRTKSMLTVPLKNLNHEVVGILQLINRKDELSRQLSTAQEIDTYVAPFSLHDEAFVLSVAPLAAVSIERAQLHENITALFEGFLNASIASIDERDRVTSGHSRRVMGYAMAFVDAAAADPGNPFAELGATHERRRQFQFAALLHDIGKIGVPEYVLTKELKISRAEFDCIMAQIDYIAVQRMINPASVSWKSAGELEEDREFLIKINRCGRIEDADRERLQQLCRKTFIDLKGNTVPLLSEYAGEALSITRGNLTAAERELINSHARSTLRILSQIPWMNSLAKVPEIAAQHHERIDGTGYPDGITGERMFLESKILAAIDIYEALVAQDRPYKPKMAPEKALEILQAEVRANHIDGDVVRFFIEKGIYKLFTDKAAEHS
ncbi:MAG: GAF domain-containing protein [Chitinispirillaceae bacterium]|nr:GAF domain-containing protein [Chitinispirillaceae bacterium]